MRGQPCVKTADGCLYNFDMFTGATYEIQTLKNNDRVIDYVDTFECNENVPTVDPLEEFLDAEGSIFPFATSSEKLTKISLSSYLIYWSFDIKRKVLYPKPEYGWRLKSFLSAVGLCCFYALPLLFLGV